VKAISMHVQISKVPTLDNQKQKI